MPLARWDDALKHGSPLEIGGEEMTPDPEQVMSWDRLHPNHRGVVLLAVLIADQIRRRYPALDGRDLRLDPEQVEARMQDDIGDAAGSTQLSD